MEPIYSHERETIPEKVLGDYIPITDPQVLDKISIFFYKFQSLFLTHPAFVKKMNENAYLAGGAIVSFYNNEIPMDYDFFFWTKESYTDVEDMLTGRNMSPSQSVDSRIPISLSKNAVTFFKPYDPKFYLTAQDPFRMQIISLRHGDPRSVCNTFDYIHCKAFAYKDKNGKLIAQIHKDAEVLIRNKKLKATPFSDPTKLYRIRKFRNRGWTFADPEEEGLYLLKEQAKIILNEGCEDFGY